MCQKEYKHTAFRVSLSLTLLNRVRVCVYFIAFGKCEFSSIICVRIFSVFVDGGTEKYTSVCVRVRVRMIMTLYYIYYLYVMML